MAKPFVFKLTSDEAALIAQPAGSGGHQGLQRRLTAELAANNNTLSFDDAEMGEVLRYAFQYGSGGFQGRLRNALIRSLSAMLGI